MIAEYLLLFTVEQELILIQKKEPTRTILYDQYSAKTLFIDPSIDF